MTETTENSGERLWPMAAVARRTGIGEHTLRAWERRFGFPQPHRLPSGHRRYTSEQVRHLGLIASLLENGHRAGDIVGPDVGKLERLLRETEGQTPPAAGGDEEWLAHVLERGRAFDRAGVSEALRRAAVGLGVARFVHERAAPLLTAVGEAWMEGRIGIRHEHFLSEVLEDVLRWLREPIEGAARGRPVLLTTLPGESHGLGLRLASLLVALAGRRQEMLGLETPQEEIVAAAEAVDAIGVGLSVSALSARADVAGSIAELRGALDEGIALWVGGGGASLLEDLPAGVDVMPSLSDLEAALERLPRA